MFFFESASQQNILNYLLKHVHFYLFYSISVGKDEKCVVEKLRKGHMGDEGVDGRIILKWTLKK
jgi:hypothetical protein